MRRRRRAGRSTNQSTAHRQPSAERAVDSAAQTGSSLGHNPPSHKVRVAKLKIAVAEVLVDCVASTAAEVAPEAAEPAVAAAGAPDSDFLAAANSPLRLAWDTAGSATP